jgi:hypothetical protein
MNRGWKGREIGDREFAHVLPANSDHVCNIREAYQVGSGFNQFCGRNCLLDVGKSTGDCGKRIFSFARKFKREATWLADSDQRVVTTSLTQAFYQRIWIGVVTGQLIAEFKSEFHRYSLVASLSWLLCVVQLSTTRLSALA